MLLLLLKKFIEITIDKLDLKIRKYHYEIKRSDSVRLHTIV